VRDATVSTDPGATLAKLAKKVEDAGRMPDSKIRRLKGLPVRLPWRRPIPKIGRNEACPCGSGRKFKKCCLGRLS
jgi:uncharacterized protein YecA (UPF0149 family)